MTSLTTNQLAPLPRRGLDSAKAWSETWSDVDAIPELFPDQSFRCTQLGGGKFLGQVEFVRLSGLKYARIRTNCDLFLLGSGPSTGVTLFLGPWSESNWRAQGRVLSRGRVIGCCPGQELEILAGAEAPGYVIHIEALEALRIAEPMACAKLMNSPPTGMSTRLQFRDFDVLRKLLIAHPYPRIAGSVDTPVTQIAGSLQVFLHAVIRALPHSDGHDGEDRRSYSDRLSLVRETRELMERNLQDSITIATICDRFCVSPRSLFYAFQDVMGISPKAYMKLRRMNQVRGELRSRNSLGKSISEIAGRWGFKHCGQFARDYRMLFEELPSRTANKVPC